MTEEQKRLEEIRCGSPLTPEEQARYFKLRRRVNAKMKVPDEELPFLTSCQFVFEEKRKDDYNRYRELKSRMEKGSWLSRADFLFVKTIDQKGNSFRRSKGKIAGKIQANVKGGGFTKS